MSEQPDRDSGGSSAGALQRPGVRALAQAGFRYAFSLTHHRQDAEDLVQQACLQVIRAKGSMTSRTYLFVTIRNLFYDAGRRRSLASFGALQAGLSDGDGLEVQRSDDKLDVETILGTLPVETRELVYLNCIEGFTAQEIADMTDRPRGTILSHLARTKRELADRFRAGCEERAVP